MIKKKLIGRIKAAVVSAAMIATTFITPSLTTFSNVTAATISVNKKPSQHLKAPQKLHQTKQKSRFQV